MIKDILTGGFLVIGCAFMLIAAIGILRMPDLFSRLQASAKAATLGAGCMLLAVAIHFSDVAITARAALIIIFIFLTAPVASHLIARAGYFVDVPLWEGALIDELGGAYKEEKRTKE